MMYLPDFTSVTLTLLHCPPFGYLLWVTKSYNYHASKNLCQRLYVLLRCICDTMQAHCMLSGHFIFNARSQTPTPIYWSPRVSDEISLGQDSHFGVLGNDTIGHNVTAIRVSCPRLCINVGDNVLKCWCRMCCKENSKNLLLCFKVGTLDLSEDLIQVESLCVEHFLK